MLKATVSLSRKLSQDYNSTGFTVSLDGEIPFPPSDREGVLEKVSELFDLAEEALNREIEESRDREIDPQAQKTSIPVPTHMAIQIKQHRSNCNSWKRWPDETNSPISNWKIESKM